MAQKKRARKDPPEIKEAFPISRTEFEALLQQAHLDFIVELLRQYCPDLLGTEESSQTGGSDEEQDSQSGQSDEKDRR